MTVRIVGATCSHHDGCRRPVYEDALCSLHYRQWRLCGGTYPGTARQRFAIRDNGKTYGVLDTLNGKTARLVDGTVCVGMKYALYETANRIERREAERHA